jgi:hypothetical protein
MSKKMLALILIGIVAVTYVAYAAYEAFVINQKANVIGIAVFIDGIPIQNDGELDWGDISIDTAYYFNLTVTNHYETNHTVYFLCVDLPTGWTQTWAANATLLEPGESAIGDLTLTATTFSSETWTSHITVTEAT